MTMETFPQQTYAHIPVLDSTLAYREEGASGQPTVLFLHGNPTSSFIWRNITPIVSAVAHCLSLDLIGFGRSGKPDIEYRFEDHIRYLDAFIEAKGLTRFFLVAQDWGTALAFHRAARHPKSVLGLGFMEFIRPMKTWEDFHPSPASRALFQAFRTPGEGERLILEENVFVERVLPGSVLRSLTDSEREAYRQPFPTPASRKPVWRFPNELPIDGKPEDVWRLVEEAYAALMASDYPKLLFSAEPGVLTPPAIAEDHARRLRNCTHIKLGPGAHYLQEDHPERIGRELARWIQDVMAGQGSAPRH
jgi:haloalkane dehalogenase